MKITIIGKGRGWQYAPKEGEIWGVNDLCSRRDVDVVFNMHAPARKGDLCWEPSVSYANKNNIPFITLQKLSDVPSSIRYPIEEMHTDYFTNSISYMIAYAIFKGATQIDLYGCTLWGRAEYAQQKPNVEYWIGYARGKGIKVNIHKKSNLMKSHDGLVYGYNTQQV